MKHALLLLVLPAHAAQISTEVSHTGHPESRWMRSEASMREEAEWRPSAQATFPRPSYGNPSWSPWSGNPGSLPGGPANHLPYQGAGYSGYGSYGSYGAPVHVQAVPRAPPATPPTPSAGPVFPKVAVSSAGPNNMKEAEAETKKFFEIEEMVAKETGLPLNSSEAAQKEEEEKAEAKEAEEEEETERFDALYAGIALVILLAAGGTFYFHRRSQLDKPKPGEAPTAAAPSSPEADPSAPGPAEAEAKAATGS
ncbi:LZTR1 [Symbiodinium sp. CCMP2456]|nr:LZTR1 [Symbiodinium sp. CCMP2456]